MKMIIWYSVYKGPGIEEPQKGITTTIFGVFLIFTYK